MYNHCFLSLIYVFYYVCVLILLYMGPCFSLEKHICVSSGILCETRIQWCHYFSLESEELHSKIFPYIYMTGGRRPHTTVYMSSYHYVCVLMILYVSSYIEGFLWETNLCLFSPDPSCFCLFSDNRHRRSAARLLSNRSRCFRGDRGDRGYRRHKH